MCNVSCAIAANAWAFRQPVCMGCGMSSLYASALVFAAEGCAADAADREVSRQLGHRRPAITHHYMRDG
jgi:hypothetical protein